MPEIDDIASQTLQTLEELFDEQFCRCNHLLKEHRSWECRALLYNGAIWTGCDCSKPIPRTFEIKLYVPIEFSTNSANNFTNQT